MTATVSSATARDLFESHLIDKAMDHFDVDDHTRSLIAAKVDTMLDVPMDKLESDSVYNRRVNIDRDTEYGDTHAEKLRRGTHHGVVGYVEHTGHVVNTNRISRSHEHHLEQPDADQESPHETGMEALLRKIRAGHIDPDETSVSFIHWKAIEQLEAEGKVPEMTAHNYVVGESADGRPLSHRHTVERIVAMWEGNHDINHSHHHGGAWN